MIKKCPFCGEIVKVVVYNDSKGKEIFAIECKTCDGDTVFWKKDKEASIAAWNKRVEIKGGGK
jgi:Lar family restriction alleviation protein